MSYCEDCGAKLSGGTCPNCQEELYIFETQSDYLPDTLSDDFSEKIKEQREERRKRRKL